jgi:hypothetical protein
VLYFLESCQSREEGPLLLLMVLCFDFLVSRIFNSNFPLVLLFIRPCSSILVFSLFLSLSLSLSLLLCLCVSTIRGALPLCMSPCVSFFLSFWSSWMEDFSVDSFPSSLYLSPPLFFSPLNFIRYIDIGYLGSLIYSSCVCIYTLVCLLTMMITF